ncbi:MAG: tyrosine-type recombinase/integrase [Anaerolineae bacterium]|nr:tyrosine-type recombinase/integrase [Anaerolineae bacterium]
MADKQYPTGCRPHGSGIKIRFSWRGERFEPVWPRKATQTNLEAAARLRAEIKSKAKLEILTWHDLAEHFPQYRNPDSVNSDVPLFGELAQDFLNTTTVSENTRNEYRKLLMKYWQPLYAAIPINQITPRQLRQAVADIEWTSAKTRNNALIPLRKVFDLAVDDELIDRNPASRIKNQKHQKPAVDPFSEKEAEQIIAWLYKNYTGTEVIYAAYYEFAFWTGMRPSEIMALTWDDVDWQKGTVRVQRAQSKGRLNEHTKTHNARDVLLNARSRSALETVKPITYMASSRIFMSPRYQGQYWKSDQQPRLRFVKALRKLGIRHRRAYNTRHTYATVCLMAGMNPTFVANQLGHSIQVLLSTYARWIHGDQSEQEMKKLGQNWDKGKGRRTK